jgi:hypothetical protein
MLCYFWNMSYIAHRTAQKAIAGVAMGIPLMSGMGGRAKVEWHFRVYATTALPL